MHWSDPVDQIVRTIIASCLSYQSYIQLCAGFNHTVYPLQEDAHGHGYM